MAIGGVAGHMEVVTVGPAFAEVVSDNTVPLGNCIHIVCACTAAEMALACRGHTVGAGAAYWEHWVKDGLLAECTRAVSG